MFKLKVRTLVILLFMVLVLSSCNQSSNTNAVDIDSHTDSYIEDTTYSTEIEAKDTTIPALDNDTVATENVLDCQILYKDIYLERIDKSIYDDSGNLAISWYFDKLTINSDCLAAESINSSMNTICDEFFSDEKAVEITSYYNGVYNYYGKANNLSFFDTNDGEITYKGDKVISLFYKFNWYMGGVSNQDYSGYTYDLTTGQQLTLSDIMYGNEIDNLAIIKSLYYIAVEECYGLNSLGDMTLNKIESKHLSDFAFYINEEAEIILIVNQFDLMFKVAPLEVSTGIYCNFN